MFISTRIWFLVAALLFVLASCSSLEEVVDQVQGQEAIEAEFVIEPGNHETTNPLRPLKKSKILFEVRFDSTAIYKTEDPTNQADINKLFGMSDCSSFHHSNSARFGWRWYQNKLELFAYSYADGKNTSTLISAIDLNKWYNCELELKNNKYTFRLDGKKTVDHNRGCTGEGVGYQLYPYFGGDEKAPHKIKIKIKEKQ
ncbi:MAG: hypothetical protein ACO1OQ_14580 [Rufibacter sp.]